MRCPLVFGWKQDRDAERYRGKRGTNRKQRRKVNTASEQRDKRLKERKRDRGSESVTATENEISTQRARKGKESKKKKLKKTVRERAGENDKESNERGTFNEIKEPRDSETWQSAREKVSLDMSSFWSWIVRD